MEIKKNQEVIMAQIIIIYFFIAYFASWWPFSSDEWEGFVYPNRADLTVHRNIGIYDSIEGCRDAAILKLEDLNALKKATMSVVLIVKSAVGTEA